MNRSSSCLLDIRGDVFGMKLLLTGPPRIGKTTVIQRVLADGGFSAAGFVTEEIRKSGKRLGFSVKTLDGNEGVLAHVDYATKHRVGRYGVDIALFERIAIPVLDQAVQKERLIVIDEIGKMELFSQKFYEILRRILDHPGANILGVICQGRDPRVAEIKKRPDVELLPVTHENRQILPSQIIGRLRHEMGI